MESIFCNMGLTEVPSTCDNIESLNLSFNNISDISGLPNYPFMISLNLSHNLISTLPITMQEWKYLTKLKLTSNNLSNVSSLRTLTSLTELWIGSNSISAVAQLKPLVTLTRLTHLVVYPNALCNDDNYRSQVIELFPSLLTLDGVSVYSTEPSHAAGYSVAAVSKGSVEYDSDDLAHDEMLRYNESNLPAANDLSDFEDDVARGEEATSMAISSRHSNSTSYIIGGTTTPDTFNNSVSSALSLLPSNLVDLYNKSKKESEYGKATRDIERQKVQDHSAGVRRGEAQPNGRKNKAKYSHMKLEAVEKKYKNGLKALVIESDGSAKVYYPNRSLAISIDPDDHSFRLFAKYMDGKHALAFDGNTVGTVCYLSGVTAMIKGNNGGGSVFTTGGQLYRVWHSRNIADVRDKDGNIQPLGRDGSCEVQIKLDKHIGITFNVKTDEVYIYFKCEDIQYKFGQGPLHREVPSGTTLFGTKPAGSGREAIVSLKSQKRLTHEDFIQQIRESTMNLG